MPRTSSLSAAAPRTRRRVATDGAALTFETLAAYDGVMPPLRIRPDEATLLRVVSGSARLAVDGQERTLGPGGEAGVPAGHAPRPPGAGGEAVVPAGHAHRLAGAGAEARVVMDFRPTPL